jgi:alkyl hydroperoxide reductase subunit AhpC
MKTLQTNNLKFALCGVLGLSTMATVGYVAISSNQPVQAAVQVGKAAPAFTLRDTNGRTHSLADFRGKYVVLEWLNHGCPFVKKHYNGGNMQRLQREAKAKGVVWLSIVSSAPGTQGNYPGAQHNAMAKQRGAAAKAILLDASGQTGRAYGAKTTPHMFVIDPKGIVRYNGAIDNQPSADAATLKGARNFVMAALNEARAGKRVSVPVTQPYGCGVKYAG